ncbi:hypothetical protein GCM10009682_52960 [Luedemannella flava]|uniref:DUF4352 domain-containing protein n=1 Tax=Luedemannella flava TaxID=349316 RepID=A0ABN2MIJ2_9ACTN
MSRSTISAVIAAAVAIGGVATAAVVHVGAPVAGAVGSAAVPVLPPVKPAEPPVPAGRPAPAVGIPLAVGLALVDGAATIGLAGERTAPRADRAARPEGATAAGTLVEELPVPRMEPTPTPSAAPSPSPDTPGTPGPAIDRNFSVTLRSATCGRTDLAPSAPNMHPRRGQYCLVQLRFTNVARYTVWFSLSAWLQRAFTSDGARHWGDLRASEAATDRGNPYFQRVRPGETTDGTVVFDLPRGLRIDRLHVRESLLSSGVDVRVP